MHDRGHAHILDIGSPGAAGVAQALTGVGMGVSVGGALDDGWRGRLARVGISADGRAGRLPPGTTLLVHPEGLASAHPARLRALRDGVRRLTPRDWLAGTMRGRSGVLVVGGRLATRVAAMVGHVLAQSGADPTVVLQRPAPQNGGWYRAGGGPHVVADWPADLAALRGFAPRLLLVMGRPAGAGPAGSGWLDGLRSHQEGLGGVLIVHDRALDDGEGGPGVETVGFGDGAGWRGDDLRTGVASIRFRVYHRGEFAGEVVAAGPGPSRAEAALGAFVACRGLGVSRAEIRAGLGDFRGLSRDFERRGTYRGVTLLDDDSGDADQIDAAIRQARRAFGGRRLVVALDEPSEAEAGRLADVLATAGRVVLLARSGRPSIDRGVVAPGGRPPDAGARVLRVEGTAGAVAALDDVLRPGDVLLTLGSGEVGTIADAFLRRLPRDRQAG